jgi:hypothetical protein
LKRAQIESLFGLQRRAALRLMAPLVSASRNGSWQVDRQRLIQWREGFEQEVTELDLHYRFVRVSRAHSDGRPFYIIALAWLVLAPVRNVSVGAG